MTQRRAAASTLAAFGGFVLLAGANGTAISFSNRELAPFWGAALRFLPAALLFLVAGLATRRAFPRGRALVGAVLYGALALGGSFGLIYWALRAVRPGMAQVVIALTPLLTLALAVAQRQERFRSRALVGAVACLAGIVIVFQEQLTRAAPVGALAALVGAAFCIAEGTILAKHYPRADIVTTNAVAMGVAGTLLLGASLASREAWTRPTLPSTWIAVAYIVLVGTVVAFALFLFVLQHWAATAAAYQWVLLPLVAVPLSALLTGERMTVALLAGGALVLAGVYVGVLWRPKPRGVPLM